MKAEKIQPTHFLFAVLKPLIIDRIASLLVALQSPVSRREIGLTELKNARGDKPRHFSPNVKEPAVTGKPHEGYKYGPSLEAVGNVFSVETTTTAGFEGRPFKTVERKCLGTV